MSSFKDAFLSTEITQKLQKRCRDVSAVGFNQVVKAYLLWRTCCFVIFSVVYSRLKQVARGERSARMDFITIYESSFWTRMWKNGEMVCCTKAKAAAWWTSQQSFNSKDFFLKIFICQAEKSKTSRRHFRSLIAVPLSFFFSAFILHGLLLLNCMLFIFSLLF